MTAIDIKQMIVNGECNPIHTFMYDKFEVKEYHIPLGIVNSKETIRLVWVVNNGYFWHDFTHELTGVEYFDPKYIPPDDARTTMEKISRRRVAQGMHEVLIGKFTGWQLLPKEL